MIPYRGDRIEAHQAASGYWDVEVIVNGLNHNYYGITDGQYAALLAYYVNYYSKVDNGEYVYWEFEINNNFI